MTVETVEKVKTVEKVETVVTVETVEKIFSKSSNALCGYPHVKVSIRDLSQISATAPIFQQYNYFRQNSEENVTFTFYFFSFASNFPCKIL